MTTPRLDHVRDAIRASWQDEGGGGSPSRPPSGSGHPFLPWVGLVVVVLAIGWFFFHAPTPPAPTISKVYGATTSAATGTANTAVAARTIVQPPTLRTTSVRTSAATTSTMAPMRVANTGGEGLRLRETPGDGATIVVLADGATVTPTGEQQNINNMLWRRVRDTASGRVGWVSANYLIAASPAETTPSDPTATVRQFYTAVSAHDLSAAWRLYSPRLRSTINYNEWEAGYAHTESVAINDIAVQERTATHATVRLTFVATDVSNGGSVAHRYQGVWGLTLIDGAWLLDAPDIALAA